MSGSTEDRPGGGAGGEGVRSSAPSSSANLLEHLGLVEQGAFDAERSRIELTFDAHHHLAHPGGVQGGFITGWIDAAMAHSVMHATEHQFIPMTLEIKITFLVAVRPGQKVRAEGWILRRGRSIAFLEGALRGEDGTLLATGTSTAKLVGVGR